MSVPVQTPVASFTANGVTTVFPYAYLLLSSGDLQVTLDGVVLTSGFVISGVGSVSGGNVTFSVAPASGTLILRRKMSLSRLVDYVEAGDLLAATLNLDLDRIWMAMQGLQSDATRSIKLPEETLTDQTIADDAATRASKLLGFDALGNVSAVDIFDPSALIVSVFIETLLSAANSVSARSILEAAADNDVVKLSGDQTVAGTKTFSSSPIVPGINGGQLAGFRNRIMNGAFAIDQRLNGAALNLNTTYQYAADRWIVTTADSPPAGTLTSTRLTVPGEGTFVRILRGSSTYASDVRLIQVIESVECADLAGKTVTFSLQARVGSAWLGGNLIMEIFTGTGVDQGVASMLAGTWTGTATTTIPAVAMTTTFATYSGQVTIPAGTTEIGVCIRNVGWSGTGGANDYLDITGVQLELGTLATPFERRAYPVELSLCQRFFEIADTTGTVLNLWALGRTSFTAGCAGGYKYAMPKRAVPTISGYSASNATGVIVVATTEYVTFNATANSTSGAAITGNFTISADL